MYFRKSLFILVVVASNCNAKTISQTDDRNDNTTELSPVDKSPNAVVINTSTEPNADKNNVAIVPNFQLFPTDLTLKTNLGQALIVGGIIVASVLLLGAVTLFLTPVFGFKLCHIMGGCEFSNNVTPLPPQQPNPIFNDVYGAYIPSAAYGTYQKRSLEYVTPIIKTLISAYEKYGQQNTKRNS